MRVCACVCACVNVCVCVCMHACVNMVCSLTWQLNVWNVLAIEVGQFPEVLDCTVTTNDGVRS